MRKTGNMYNYNSITKSQLISDLKSSSRSSRFVTSTMIYA